MLLLDLQGYELRTNNRNTNIKNLPTDDADMYTITHHWLNVWSLLVLHLINCVVS